MLGHSKSSFTNTASRRRSRRGLRVEYLEKRRLLAVLTVDTDTDLVDGSDGLTSLREAVVMANELPGADEIVFDFGHDGPTVIRLKQGELTISESLRIDATGLSSGLMIDAAGNDLTPTEKDGQGSRIFSINDGDPFADSRVTIRGLTLTGGDVHDDGGAIHSREILSIEFTSIVGNSSGSDGGGIWASNVIVNSSTIANNSAKAYGGGIQADEANVNFTTIAGNSARSGGGISATIALVESSTITDNHAEFWGGGIRTRGTRGEATVNNSTISNNSVRGSDEGAGIYSGGNLTVNSSTVSANTADRNDSGSVYSYGNLKIASSTSDTMVGSDNGSVEVSDSTIAGISAHVDATVSSSTIVGSPRFGIEAGRDVFVHLTSISGSTWSAIESKRDVTVTSSTISENGRGISARNDIAVHQSTIHDNSGTGVKGQNVTVTSSTISGNTSNCLYCSAGAGISATNVTVRHSTITGNSDEGPRTGVWIPNPLRVGGISSVDGTITNSIVAGNWGNLSPSDVFRVPDIQFSLIGDLRIHEFPFLHQGTSLAEAPVGSPDANGNLVGGPIHGTIDPRLGPLADNGGSTWTHALLPDSPAIDSGNPQSVAGTYGVPLYDQRGESFAMSVDGNQDGVSRIDVGAHERQSLAATIVDVPSLSVNPVDELTIQFSEPVHSFDIGHLRLSLNGGPNLLTGSETLSTSDNQTFLLSGLADRTRHSGYYTVMLDSSLESQLVSVQGRPLDAGAKIGWAMGRSESPLTVNTFVDEADGRIDDGDVSLRDAISAAAPGETIGFDASLSGAVIQLTLGELLIDRSVTIDATILADQVEISAQGNDPTPAENDGRGSRVITIDDHNLFTDSPVTIRGLRLTGGDVAANGGAIRSQETLFLEFSTVSQNFAISDGGGIAAKRDVTVSSSTISRNGSGQSGAIRASGDVTLHSSRLTENTATVNGGMSAVGDVTVDSTTISENTGLCSNCQFGSGPAIQTEGNVTIHSSKILSNEVDGSSTISGNLVTVDSSNISLNSGTGISGKQITVESSTVTENAGNGINGRGVVSVSFSTISANGRDGVSGGTVAVISSTISDNRASGIFAYREIAVHSSTISSNENSGIIMPSNRTEGIVEVFSSTISGNIGEAGGGIHTPGVVRVHSSTISGNSATTAGAIRAEDVTVQFSTVTGNSATSVDGILGRRGEIFHSIVANGGDDADVRFTAARNPMSLRYSIIGNNRGTDLLESPTGVSDADGNQIGGLVHGIIDPRLGPLMDNGGPTFTHALLPGSPAINMGDAAAVANSGDVPQFDQRDAPHSRIVDGRIDMGAFERGIDGDTNGDGKVDFADFLVLAANFGTGQRWSEGNFDGSEDGTQFADFVALSANFGREEPSSGDHSNARRAAATKSAMILDLNADHSRRQTELVDDLLASELHEWLSES